MDIINGINDKTASASSCGSGFPESRRGPENASTMVQTKIAIQTNGTAVKVPQIMTLTNERSNNIHAAPILREKRIANKSGPMLSRMAENTVPCGIFDYLYGRLDLVTKCVN
jgi:hypothetical protein